MSSCIVLYFYSVKNPGGAERRVCDLANSLFNAGYSIRLITLDSAKTSAFYPIDVRIPWHRLGHDTSRLGKLKRIWSLFMLLKLYKVESLVGFVMSGDKTVYIAALMARVRLIAAERNSPVMYQIRYSFFQRLVSFNLLRLTDKITVQQDGFHGGYPKYLRNKIRTIWNPVALPAKLASPHLVAKGTYKLLFVGRFDFFQKQVEILVKAFDLLAEDSSLASWNLVLVGDGEDREKVLSLIGGTAYESRVQVIGETKDLASIYLQSHLFAFPSRWEGFPNSLAEALSYGLPAVGFKGASGVRELIKDGSNGWLAEGNGDPKTFAKALREAMLDSHERRRRGLNAHESVRKFTKSSSLERWINCIQETI